MKKTPKQIAALFGIGLILSLYVLLLIFAIFDFNGRDILFRACLLATIILPILIWIYMYLYDKLIKSRNGNNTDTNVTLHK